MSAALLGGGGVHQGDVQTQAPSGRRHKKSADTSLFVQSLDMSLFVQSPGERMDRTSPFS